ncbi:CDP-alcohol phosphatidyltransferase family protein [Plebeiibacterium sediminum]|uniref:CDP-alcohol phosphatidyltransferase family protein n=1 Tax=Plebeiibacterium sediminum TaxID=2992112 RepID=A0AAE3M1F2_9BACT|nr:CDP-alcohol phosphatidyltransferase family protein [Plebeiobacterium sediminum]MCW3785030.1 CDP-alcohol phosphatidyltransferase family protein [Plebeiobacterium sediminum]
MSVKNHIPNFITSLNLLCGALAAFYALNGKLGTAALLIFAGALFDFTDGFAARMLKAYSPMGKELDSLADMISFGFAPMAILHMMLKQTVLGDIQADFFQANILNQAFVLSPFVITVFSGLRLAKFNVDTRQTESFIGLTTTATGLFISSLGFVFVHDLNWLNDLIQNQWLLLTFVPVFSFLLVSEIPMFSLKFKNFKLLQNLDKFVLLLSGLIMIVWLGVGGIAVVIALYVFFSVIKLVFVKIN